MKFLSCFLLVATLSACGSSSPKSEMEGSEQSQTQSSVQDTDTQDDGSVVTEAEFRQALSKMEVTRDEFVGNYEVFPRFTVSFFSKDNGNMFTIGLSFTKEDEESPWETFLVSAYNGEDWIFHDEANLKSSRGVLNLENLESLNRDVSGGKVTEYSVIDLTEETFNKYCDIIQADNVLFRLRGTEISDVQGQMTETSRRAEKAMCVVGLGLRQGFIP